MRFALAFSLLLSILLSGCGYKPSAHYARKVIKQKVATAISIAVQDPENSVIIKDAVDLAIVEVFHASLTDKKHADTFLEFHVSEPTYTPIQYNQDGFVVAYRANIVLHIVRHTKGQTPHNYTTYGTYDFSVVPNAVLTDQERFDAIKYSSQKAISSFIAQVSAEGSQKDKS